jgi:cell division protein FtsN
MSRLSSARPTTPVAARRGGGRSSRKSGFGGTLLGLFIGIALGLGLAAGVAYYVMKAGNPYQPAVTAGARDSAKDPTRTAKVEPGAPDKPRFDFYKILPSGEDAKGPPKAAEKAPAERVAPPEKAAVAKLEDRPPPAAAPEKPAPRPVEAPPAPAAKPAERFWLQAGSFSTEGDAENMKAQLALSGLEPTLQHATLPDKSVRFRVRLGPYASADEMNRVKADLAKRGVDVAVIR